MRLNAPAMRSRGRLGDGSVLSAEPAVRVSKCSRNRVQCLLMGRTWILAQRHKVGDQSRSIMRISLNRVQVLQRCSYLGDLLESVGITGGRRRCTHIPGHRHAALVAQVTRSLTSASVI